MEYFRSKIQQLVYTNVYTMSEGDIQISCVLYKRQVSTTQLQAKPPREKQTKHGLER